MRSRISLAAIFWANFEGATSCQHLYSIESTWCLHAQSQRITTNIHTFLWRGVCLYINMKRKRGKRARFKEHFHPLGIGSANETYIISFGERLPLKFIPTPPPHSPGPLKKHCHNRLAIADEVKHGFWFSCEEVQKELSPPYIRIGHSIHLGKMCLFINVQIDIYTNLKSKIIVRIKILLSF